MANHTDTPDIAVAVHGDVTAADRGYAVAKLEHLAGLGERPARFRRVDLTLYADPARERRAEAKAEVDLDGGIVRAHADAPTMPEAIDALEARMRERIIRSGQRVATRFARFRDRGAHEWRRGQSPAVRSAYFPRPVEERRIVRGKSFTCGAMTPDEAVAEMESLDHDFYLFVNIETGDDNVIARVDDGYELHEPGARCALRDAVEPITASPVRPGIMTEQDAARCSTEPTGLSCSSSIRTTGAAACSTAATTATSASSCRRTPDQTGPGDVPGLRPATVHRTFGPGSLAARRARWQGPRDDRRAARPGGRLWSATATTQPRDFRWRRWCTRRAADRQAARSRRGPPRGTRRFGAGASRPWRSPPR